MVAVLFSYPLVAAPESTPTNKILWVTHDRLESPGSLLIDAQLEGRGPVVHREVANGPGPSNVDMPRPGCWRLTLSWEQDSETMDLQYGEPDGRTRDTQDTVTGTDG